jgi:hypothetical protein
MRRSRKVTRDSVLAREGLPCHRRGLRVLAARGILVHEKIAFVVAFLMRS